MASNDKTPGFSGSSCHGRNEAKTTVEGTKSAAESRNTLESPTAHGHHCAQDGTSCKSEEPRLFPGCSYGEGRKKQPFTEEMMQAYMALRGRDVFKGPLRKWMDESKDTLDETLESYAKNQDRKLSPARGPLNGADEDTPSDPVPQFMRPDNDHLFPHADQDLSFHRLCAAPSGLLYDSEDEGDETIPSGRISPCTFLKMAEGCAADSQRKPSFLPMALEKEKRMRPPTGTVPPGLKDQGQDPKPYYMNIVPQRDVLTGLYFSPEYQVGQNADIIYTPPGFSGRNFAAVSNEEFPAQYRRMQPMLARQLDLDHYGINSPEPTPASNGETYGASEVQRVFDTMSPTRPDSSTGANAPLPSDPEMAWAEAKFHKSRAEAATAERAQHDATLQKIEQDLTFLRTVAAPALARRDAEAARRHRIRRHVRLSAAGAGFAVPARMRTAASMERARDQQAAEVQRRLAEVEEQMARMGRPGATVEDVMRELGMEDEEEQQGNFLSGSESLSP
ncbi:hypothetical protein GGR56DRAFT_367958 [Xylariaceae sp. FL0804]|nr:hypothetical protein GGR56DRAFT_367958 [Xylariaceae sp. FL0804]